MDGSAKQANEAIEQVCAAVLGKRDEVREVMTALLADGHILLEDIPGVGKTTLARAFSRTLGLDCRRVQFTPDVMPSDLTGFSIYRREEERFVYQPGCVFCSLLLADELNRTSPRTQSALLEVMEERRVTAEGVTRPVPEPFLVIATQNPYGASGTQPLPEAQVDRFMVSLSLGYPDFESELQMARAVGGGGQLDCVRQAATREEFLAMQRQAARVYLCDAVCRYLLQLVTATRAHRSLERGASPRATVALVRLSRAAAFLAGRDFVTPQDVAEQFPHAVRHRLLLSASAKMEGVRREALIAELLGSVRRPRMEAPDR